MNRVGIFAGTFDPVHIGHIAFALRAIEKAQLDQVIFLPERMPRHKKDVTDFKHRLKMLRLSAKSFELLEVLALPDPYFTTSKTLPELEKSFFGAELSLLLGSDVAKKIGQWEDLDTLTKNVNLIIGLRKNDSPEELVDILSRINPDLKTQLIRTRYPEITATQAREDKSAKLAPAAYEYIKKQKLYSS